MIRLKVLLDLLARAAVTREAVVLERAAYEGRVHVQLAARNLGAFIHIDVPAQHRRQRSIAAQRPRCSRRRGTGGAESKGALLLARDVHQRRAGSALLRASAVSIVSRRLVLRSNGRVVAASTNVLCCTVTPMAAALRIKRASSCDASSISPPVTSALLAPLAGRPRRTARRRRAARAEETRDARGGGGTSSSCMSSSISSREKSNRFIAAVRR